MRRSARHDVLQTHLRRILARRDDLRRILGGGRALVSPTSDERARFETEYVGLGLVERALETVLAGADASARKREREHDFSLAVEAAVLTELRARVAVGALLLQQPEAQRTERDEDAERAAVALFRYLNVELQRLADDAAAAKATRRDPPVPPKPLDPDRAVERMIAIGGWGNLVGGPF